MNATRHHPAHTALVTSRRQPATRRMARLAGGLLLVTCAIVLIAAGAFAVAVRSGGTYLSLGAHGSYQTGRYALATDSTDWRTELLGWVGSVRLRVESEGQKPIFVGVATPGTIGRYLCGTSYTSVSERAGRGVLRADHDGAAPTTPPERAVDWTTQAEGTGTLTARWHAAEGRQVVFAMNADGSRPVRVRVVSSAVTLARMPWWVPAGLLALGLGLLPAGAVVLRRTRRRQTRRDISTSSPPDLPVAKPQER